MPISKSKKCRECGKESPTEHFMDASFSFNPRGKTCADCSYNSALKPYENGQLWAGESQWALIHLYFIQQNNTDWIKHVPPGVYYRLLRPMVRSCLYCGINWGPRINIDRKQASIVHPVMDHMDPLSSGGLDEPVNIAICCAYCNGSKGSRKFAEWLSLIPAERQTSARDYYMNRHGRNPEAFIAGPPVKTRKTMNPALGHQLGIPDDSKYADLAKIFIYSDMPDQEEASRLRLQHQKLFIEVINEALSNLKWFPWLPR